MRVLVAAASRHESTAEVAEQIARALSGAGHDVVRLRVEEVVDVTGYDAVVVGSAIYYGRWLRAALGLVEAHQAALARLPLWLFSVGALVDDAPAAAPPPLVAEVVRRTAARGHRSFRGALAAERLGWRERLAVLLVRAPYGDFRDWAAVRAWAETIAHALAEPRVPTLAAAPGVTP
ncbi:MAG: flavodoxin domain-containing protein [Vicinamibacteria bacterium]